MVNFNCLYNLTYTHNDNNLRGKMVGVYFSSPTNSTMFTECCEVAILDYEDNCPKCDKEVVGSSEVELRDRLRIRWNDAKK